MSFPLVLLGTESCHLCEQAEELVLSALCQFSGELAFIKIDIAEESQYLASYELRIPVLCHFDSGKELQWPFDKAQVLLFIKEVLD
jgi:hypothetical protein